MVSMKLILALAATAAPTMAYESYMAKIPNGDALGKAVGHAGADYTPFGTMFSKNGKTWAGVCKEKWPGQTTVTVGAVLGDPCCKWTSGKPDFELSAPFLAGKQCATDAKPTDAPASKAPAPAPAASKAPAPAPGPAPAPASKAPAPAPATGAPTEGPGKVQPGGKPGPAPAPAPAPVPGSAGNGTVPGPAPTPAASKPSSGKPHKLCV